MKKGLLLLAIAAMTMAPVSASAAVRMFIGGPVVYGGWYAVTVGQKVHLHPAL